MTGSKVALNSTLVLSGAKHGARQRLMQLISSIVKEVCDSGHHLHGDETVHSSSSAPF